MEGPAVHGLPPDLGGLQDLPCRKVRQLAAVYKVRLSIESDLIWSNLV